MFLLALIILLLIPDFSYSACSAPAGIAGQVQYISTDMKYCDGTNWKTLTESNLGTSCTGETGKINWLSPNLRFCNGTNWIKMNTSINAGSAAGTQAGTMRYHSGSQKMQVSNATNWYELGVTPVAPSGISITHTDNNRTISVTWTAGINYGTCSIQYRSGISSWTTVSNGSVDCNTSLSSSVFTLKTGTTFNGYNWTSTGTDIRIIQDSSSSVIYSSANSINCAATSSSTTATSDVDEDCNGTWDNTVSQGVTTAPGNIGTAYSCPATYTNGLFNGAFTKVYFEADFTHYTSGTCLTFAYNLTHCAVSTSASGTIPSSTTHEDYDGNCDWSSSFPASANSSACQNPGSYYLKRAATQWDRRVCNYLGYN